MDNVIDKIRTKKTILIYTPYRIMFRYCIIQKKMTKILNLIWTFQLLRKYVCNYHIKSTNYNKALGRLNENNAVSAILKIK